MRFSPAKAALWSAAALLAAAYFYLNVVSLRGATLTDFHVYWEALRNARSGKAVYDLSSPMPFLYPPFYLLLLWPLGCLGEAAAASVWLYAQNVFLVASAVALVATFRPAGSTLAALATILFAGFSPVMLNNLYGQTNLLYLALLGLFILGYARSAESDGIKKHTWTAVAALALSAAISIRILPLGLLAAGAIERRRGIVLLTLGLVLAEALAAGAIVGFSTEIEYFRSYIFGLRGLENMRDLSLLALAERIAPPPLGTALYAAALAGAITVFAAFVLGPMRRGTVPAALSLSFVIASMVLFAPLLEYHHYTILLAPYVLVLGELGRRGALTPKGSVPVFASWAIVSASNQLSHYRFGGIGFAALGGAVLLWCYTVWLIATDGRTARETRRPAEKPRRDFSRARSARKV